MGAYHVTFHHGTSIAYVTLRTKHCFARFRLSCFGGLHELAEHRWFVEWFVGRRFG